MQNNMHAVSIKRTIGNREYEFELTSQEMMDAYYEMQFKFDRDDVCDAVLPWPGDEALYEVNGVHWSLVEPHIDEIAIDMRRNINKYDMAWQEARDVAINECTERILLEGCNV